MPPARGPSDLRRVHRSMALRALLSQTARSRAELAEAIGLSGMAVTRITRELIAAGLVRETGKRARNGVAGRRQTVLGIDPAGAYVAGLVISAFGHRVALADATGRIVARREFDLPEVGNPDKAIETSCAVLEQVIDESGIDRGRLCGVGAAIAAFIERDAGRVLQSSYFGWETVEFGAAMAERLGLPVTIENISDAMTLAEARFGEPEGIADAFLVHVGAAVGGSLLKNGAIARGTHPMGGQIGHLPVEPGPLKCFCGRDDCLNTVGSGWSVLARLGRASGGTFKPDEVDYNATAISGLIEADPDVGTAAGDALHDAGRRLGEAMRSVFYVIDPSVVILAGRMTRSRAFAGGFDSAWERFAERLPGPPPERRFGRYTAIESAVLIALDGLVYSARLDLDSLVSRAGETARRRAGAAP